MGEFKNVHMNSQKHTNLMMDSETERLDQSNKHEEKGDLKLSKDAKE